MKAAAVILVLGLALRCSAARGDLRLDELWTLEIVRDSAGVADILWGRPIDNNHQLNSLYLALLGPDASPLSLRSLAVAASTAQVAAAGWLALRWGRLEALLAMAAFAVSFPFVVHGAEARGYSLLLLFSTLAWRETELWLETPSRSRTWRLALWIGVGFWAHPTMAATAAALGFWVLWRLRGRSPGWSIAIGDWVSAFAPTALATLVANAGMLRGYRYGVANFLHRPSEAAGELYAYLAGLPAATPATPWFVAATVAACGVTGWLFQCRDRSAPLFLAGTVLAPTALVAAAGPQSLAPRYFLVPGFFLTMLLVKAAARARDSRSRVVKAAAVLVVAVFFGGNLRHHVRFAAVGAGDLGPALTAVVAGMPPGEISVASHQEWRGRLPVEHIARRLPGRLRFAPRESWRVRAPDLLLVSGEESGWRAPKDYGLVTGDGEITIYRTAATVRHYGLTGLDWAILRRVSGG